MATLLVTGFEPFATVSRNPSWFGLEALSDLPEGVVVKQLPVAWQACDQEIATLIREIDPEMILCLGVHSGGEASGRSAQTFYPESLAHNADEAAIADNAGQSRDGKAISEDQPLNAPIEGDFISELDSALRIAGFQSQISQDAGRYLCNHAYYRVLEARYRNETRLKFAAFVHVPPTQEMHPQGLADEAYSQAYQILIDAMLDAGALTP